MFEVLLCGYAMTFRLQAVYLLFFFCASDISHDLTCSCRLSQTFRNMRLTSRRHVIAQAILEHLQKTDALLARLMDQVRQQAR